MLFGKLTNGNGKLKAVKLIPSFLDGGYGSGEERQQDDQIVRCLRFLEHCAETSR